MSEEELGPGTKISETLELLAPLNSGGMADVWIAEDSARDAKVAVKFIARHLSLEPSVAERFRREAEAAAQIDNEHVVRQYAYATTEKGTPYIVMELLKGEDLFSRLASEKKLPPDETLRIVREMCEALEAAHARGIVHRDIKPENVFLTPSVKILDFGLAKIEGLSNLTKTGTVVGTPHYMSPEQMMGAKDADRGVDIWATTVLAFQMLTGRLPIEAPTMPAFVLALASAEIPAPSSFNPDLSKEVDAWFARGCARDRKKRFKSARELAESLEKALQGEAPEPPPPSSVVKPPQPPAAQPEAPATRRSKPVRLPPARPSAAPIIFAIIGGVLVTMIVIWFMNG